MKKSIIFILLTVSIALSAQTDVPKTLKNEIEALIYSNALAMEKENLAAIEKQLDDGLRENTMRVQKLLAQNYDFSVKVISIKILCANSEYATVQVIQETKKISGPAFQNNRVTVVHTLIRKDGSWKFYATALQKVEPLP